MTHATGQRKLSSGAPSVAPGRGAVPRALAELRRGTGVVLLDDAAGTGLLVLAAEAARGVDALVAAAGGPAACIVPGARAAALALQPAGEGNVAIQPVADVPGRFDAAFFRTFAGMEESMAAADCARTRLAAPLEDAAVELVKLARLLPAAIAVSIGGDPGEFAAAQDLLTVTAGDLQDYRRVGEDGPLTLAAHAPVPLEGAEKAEVYAFRPADGGKEHLAIVIGSPAADGPVLARIHSECFTGDLLGSLRCDCGEQLRGAIRAIAAGGGGVLLYLAQEGRGIGLVNKLRAYRLQDAGFDTIEANERLGFDADERVYRPAATMLRALGYDRVRLLTNNPAKVEGLTACGIEVAERVPHAFPANGHNENYLRTKAARAGHLL